MGEFSGGWAMRAGLARMLFRKPDLLLLDEPTNHLDLDANLWFEKYLSSFNGGVLITSHDRAFLNQVATRVLAIETDEVVLLRGDYDHYLAARERSLEIKWAAKARQEREVQRQMRFVERFRSKARKATQVQSRLKQLEKMQTIELPRATRKVHYSFPAAARGGSEVVRLTNVSKSYGDKCRLPRHEPDAFPRRPGCAGRTERRRQDHYAEGARRRHSSGRGGEEDRPQRGDGLLRTTRARTTQPGQYPHRGAATGGARGIGAEPP